MKQWSEVKSKWVERWPDHHPIVLQWLFQQGLAIDDLADLNNFDYQADVHDPRLLPDIEVAAKKLVNAIKNNDRIIVFADYDADGLPGASIVDQVFKKIGFKNYVVKVANRNIHGFGLKEKHVMEMIADNVDLVMTIDCGSASIDALKLAHEKNLEVIVTDHHQLPDEFDMKMAAAVVNPYRIDSNYPDKEICGAVVVFKLMQVLLEELRTKEGLEVGAGWEKWLLDLVAIATVGDMMPLRGENRTLVHYGLLVLNKTKHYGLRALIDQCGLQRGSITETDISFKLAPRINAASRVGEINKVLELLLADDPEAAGQAAADLEVLNTKRKKILTQMLKQAHKKIGKVEEFYDEVVVLGDPEWLPGMCGLLASRLVDEYDRSAFVWGRGPGDKLKGSCRAGEGDNVYQIMQGVSCEIIESCGGHVAAGGFVLNDSRLHQLPQALAESHRNASPDLAAAKISANDQNVISVDPDQLDLSLHQAIEQYRPFGVAWPEPIFEIQASPTLVEFGKSGNHLRINISDNLSGIMWRTCIADLPIKSGEAARIQGSLEFDNYIGDVRLQIKSLQQPT
jgi:single-stranded-DNA-specific exonuclease